VITTQQVADRLSDAKPADHQFSEHVVEVNRALLAGYRCAEDGRCIANLRMPHSERASLEHQFSSHQPFVNGQHLETTKAAGQLREAVVDMVRSQLRQGYHISIEYTDARHFKVGSWQRYPTIHSPHEDQVLSDLARCLAEHLDQYVKLIAIDPHAKKRVLEKIVYSPRGSLVG
jgi:carbon dioxide concentrating mechanism protein CcmM